ncbi:MAG: chloride channel protein [Phycisphaerales bacterium]|nr:chloride channel protein [Phycisphaerales bacterium]
MKSLKAKIIELFSGLITVFENKRARNLILISLPFWVASFITGIFVVGYSVTYSYIEDHIAAFLHIYPLFIFVLSPLAFLFGCGMIMKWCPPAGGSGNAQMFVAVESSNIKHEEYLVDKFLNLKVVFFKVLSSFLMIIGGAAMGPEGPTLQIAPSIFRWVQKRLPAYWPYIPNINILIAGASAGLAAAFNTPLGGIVFAVEEFSKFKFVHYRTYLFTSVIIAGLASRGIMGSYLYLGKPEISTFTIETFFIVVLTAFISGFFGAGICQIIYRLIEKKQKLKRTKHHLIWILSASMITACFIYFLGTNCIGSGKELMAHMLFDELHVSSYKLFLQRLIPPIVASSTGGAGGFFAPGLAIGASIGNITGTWFNLTADALHLMMLVGMVGFLTGIIRAPFTAAILVLEMSNGSTVVFALMAAAIIAEMASLSFGNHSMYEKIKKDIINSERKIANPDPYQVVKKPHNHDNANNTEK